MIITNRLLWFITAALLLAGAALPMFSFRQFYVFDSTYSLFSGIVYLFMEGEGLLGVIIALFSVVMPAMKMAILYAVFSGRREHHRHRALLEKLVQYGKWSMLDVFVVAVLVSSVKLGSLANVETRIGIYLFCLGVLGSIWLSARALRQPA